MYPGIRLFSQLPCETEFTNIQQGDYTKKEAIVFTDIHTRHCVENNQERNCIHKYPSYLLYSQIYREEIVLTNI